MAVDLSATSGEVIRRAHHLATAFGCRLSMMLSLENFPEDMPGEIVPPEGVDKQEWFKEYAWNSLNGIARDLAIEKPDIHAVIGPAKKEIIHFAQQGDVDLMVVGSHERHGLSLFLRSTTDGVVHNAPCDVLAVHIGR